jgi:hypothetical protein
MQIYDVPTDACHIVILSCVTVLAFLTRAGRGAVPDHVRTHGTVTVGQIRAGLALSVRVHSIAHRAHTSQALRLLSTKRGTFKSLYCHQSITAYSMQRISIFPAAGITKLILCCARVNQFALERVNWTRMIWVWYRTCPRAVSIVPRWN